MRRGLAALVVAFAVWLPLVHFLFVPREPRLERARALLEEQRRAWTEPERRRAEVERLRAANNEWDFMGRTFLVWALAEMSLRDPSTTKANLEVVDAIIDETLAAEKLRGIHFFLMSYSRRGEFRVPPARSLFLDGEIALMLGMRRVVSEKEELRAPFQERIAAIDSRLRKGPVLCGESYPDECWIFCNAAALAALRFSDFLDGTDHRPFFKEWVATAKARLTHEKTGLLISSFTVDGHAQDGPEGSSIWFACHCLRLVDESFARDQYSRARRELARCALGFAWAKEWPSTWESAPDVDSGPIVPIVNASSASSGLLILGAASFEDDALLEQLLASLDFAGFPIREKGGLRYAASNQVGDAVLLYALVTGPRFQKVGAP